MRLRGGLALAYTPAHRNDGQHKLRLSRVGAFPSITECEVIANALLGVLVKGGRAVIREPRRSEAFWAKVGHGRRHGCYDVTWLHVRVRDLWLLPEAERERAKRIAEQYEKEKVL